MDLNDSSDSTSSNRSNASNKSFSTGDEDKVLNCTGVNVSNLKNNLEGDINRLIKIQPAPDELKSMIFSSIEYYIKKFDFFNGYLKEESYVDDLMVKIVTDVMKFYETRYNLKGKREICLKRTNHPAHIKGKVGIKILANKSDSSEDLKNFVPIMLIKNKNGEKSTFTGFDQTILSLSSMKTENPKPVYGIISNGTQFCVIKFEGKSAMATFDFPFLNQQFVSNEKSFLEDKQKCLIIDVITSIIHDYFK